MPALSPGAKAPDISLPALDGDHFSLHETLRRGPVVLGFFKISCPVCQYALPFLQRIYAAHAGNTKVSVIGVSQDDAGGTSGFAQEFGLTFPILLDDTRRYPASNAYGLTNVPTVVLISADGKVEFTSVGWDRHDMERLNQRLAESAGAPAVPIFKPGEEVVDYKPG
jgi:peroxiredoxin